jgi:hypothetical protein
MALLDFIKNRNAAEQQPAAKTQQAEPRFATAKSAEAPRLPAELTHKTSAAKNAPAQTPVENERGRGHGPGMER